MHMGLALLINIDMGWLTRYTYTLGRSRGKGTEGHGTGGRALQAIGAGAQTPV